MAWGDEEQPAPRGNAPAGWYPDGRSAGWDRWWDGTEWIDRYRVVDTSERPATHSDTSHKQRRRARREARSYETPTYETSGYDAGSYDTGTADTSSDETAREGSWTDQGSAGNEEWSYRGPDGETVRIPDWIGRTPQRSSGGCLRVVVAVMILGVFAALVGSVINSIRSDNDTTDATSGVTASTLVPNVAPTGDVVPTNSPLMFVVGDLAIPAGPQGELSVVSIGNNVGDAVPVIVRNMTDTTYSSVTVSAQGSNNFGENVGPMPLGPGEWGIGYVSFDSIPTALDFEAVGDTSIPSSYVFFRVDEAVFDPSTDRITGTVTNTFDTDLDGGDVLAQAVCVRDGFPIAVNIGVPSVDTLPVMAPSPFTINTFGIDCSSFAVVAFTIDRGTEDLGTVVEGAPVQAS